VDLLSKVVDYNGNIFELTDDAFYLLVFHEIQRKKENFFMSIDKMK